MTAPNIFKPATRRATKLKLAVQGPSGSGKTLGALALAVGLARGGKVAVIDTENGSASLYADRYGFDTLTIAAPYLTAKYEQAVTAAIQAGYAVVVIDSISHQWEGDGSILQRKEAVDARGGNHFSNWEPFTKEHNKFRALLLNSPVHIVATMRSKMAYAQEQNGSKTAIKKLGLQPIQREGMEYEFAITFDVQMDHKATASKDRTDLFGGGQLIDLLDDEVVKSLLGWLDSAAPALPPAPEPAPEAAARIEEVPGREPEATAPRADGVVDFPSSVVFDFGKKHNGSLLGDIPTDYLEWVVEKATMMRDELKAACIAELKKRQAAPVGATTQSLDERPAALEQKEDDDLPF